MVELTDRVQALEQQLAEKTSAADDAESRAERVETRAAELESLVETAGGENRETASEEVTQLREAVRENEEVIAKIRQELSDWEQRWEAEEQRNRLYTRSLGSADEAGAIPDVRRGAPKMGNAGVPCVCQTGGCRGGTAD